jgi:hypothetical protein
VQTADGPRLCRLREAQAAGAAPRWFLHGELA